MLHPPPREIAERGQRESESRGEEVRRDRQAEQEHGGEGEQWPATGDSRAHGERHTAQHDRPPTSSPGPVSRQQE